RLHPSRPDAVKRRQLLLTFALNRNGVDRVVARRLEHSLHVRAVGLRALHVGTHREGRKQLYLVTQLLERASPVMGGAARFHDDSRLGLLRYKRAQLLARQPMASRNFAWTL